MDLQRPILLTMALLLITLSHGHYVVLADESAVNDALKTPIDATVGTGYTIIDFAFDRTYLSFDRPCWVTDRPYLGLDRAFSGPDRFCLVRYRP
jgi:hypothetical protein